MFIDTHCHLTFEQYKEDLAMVLGNAKKAGVKQFICPGVNELSSRLTVELAKKHPGVVFAAVGFHPYEASHNPDISILEKLTEKNIVAIGECGLDYYRATRDPSSSPALAGELPTIPQLAVNPVFTKFGKCFSRIPVTANAVKVGTRAFPCMTT